jgi:septin family protein
MKQLPEDNQGAPVKVLVTGMSGTGKSTVLSVLSQHGHRVLDTDSDAWSRWATLPVGSPDWVWREDKIAQVLKDHHSGSFFVAGCKSNKVSFIRSLTISCCRRHPKTLS